MGKIKHDGVSHIGDRYGKLTILSFYIRTNNEVKYLCKCDCGNDKIVSFGNLYNKNVRSCGCYRKECKNIRNQKRLSKNGTKYCVICKSEKSSTLFYISEKYRCIECEKNRKKQDRINNPKKYKDRALGKWLMSNYKISENDFNEMKLAQNNLCAICNNPQNYGSRLFVDHCHKTGKVRGLLCSSCNTAIGHFRENIDTMFNAIEYIKKYK